MKNKQKEELRELFQDYFKNGEDCNHWLRRFYRCYIDGSYKGSEHYQRNIETLESIKTKQSSLQTFARSEFRAFLCVEFSLIPASSMGKFIAECMTPEQNAKLTAELIADALDLIAR